MVINGRGNVGITSIDVGQYPLRPAARFQVGWPANTRSRTVSIKQDDDNYFVNNNPVAIVNANGYGLTLGAVPGAQDASIQPALFSNGGGDSATKVPLILAPQLKNRLGVGTTAPTGKFHVDGGAATSGADAKHILFKARAGRRQADPGGRSDAGQIILQAGDTNEPNQGNNNRRMGYVRIENELVLNPVDRTGQNPQRGALVYDSNDNKLYFRDNTQWVPIPTKTADCYKVQVTTDGNGRTEVAGCPAGTSLVSGGTSCWNRSGEAEYQAEENYVFASGPLKSGNNPAANGWLGGCRAVPGGGGTGKAHVYAVCCANVTKNF
jgi:hypothetical protein